MIFVLLYILMIREYVGSTKCEAILSKMILYSIKICYFGFLTPRRESIVFIISGSNFEKEKSEKIVIKMLSPPVLVVCVIRILF